MSTEEIKEYIGTQLKALTSIASPTGFTKNATDYLMKQLEAMGYAPQLSNKGNVSVEIGGEGAPLVLAAHVDTLGAMVRSIKDNGRLRPTTIGGHQWSTADGENCMVFTRDGRMYTGVVLNTEPSAHVADEKVETKEENMEILLDKNVNDKQGVAALGIQTGDIIAMDPRTVITESGYIKSRFLDDKLSAAILLGVAHAVKEEGWKLNRKVTLLFTVYEEVGHGGSFVPADTEEMISVDMAVLEPTSAVRSVWFQSVLRTQADLTTMSLSQSFQIWQRARGLTMQSMFIRTMAQMSRLHCTADMISVMGL